MAKAGAIRAGRAYVEIGADNNALTRGLRAAQARLASFAAGVRSMGLKAVAVGGAVLTPLAAAVNHFSNAGDALDKMSKRTGIAVETLSELSHAAGQSGTDLAAVETAVRRMQRTITDAEDGVSTATDALDGLGLSIDQLRGLSPEEQFLRIADAMDRIADPTRKAAIAQEIFGRSGTALLPMLEGGRRGLEQLRQEARDFGLVVSTDAAKRAAVLNDTLGILWKTVRMGVFTVGEALAPMVTDLAGRVARVIVSVNKWISANKPLVVTIAKWGAGILAVGFGLIALSVIILAASVVLGGLATAVSLIVTIFGAMLSPIGLAVLAVGGLATALVYMTDTGSAALRWLVDQFTALGKWVSDVVGGIADAIMAGELGLAAEIAMLAVRSAFTLGMEKIKGLWTGWVYDLQGALLVIEHFAGALFDRLAKGVMHAFDTAIGLLVLAARKAGDLLGVEIISPVVDKAIAQDIARRRSDRLTELRENDAAREQQLRDQLSALEQARASELNKSEQEMAEAATKLREAIDKARQAREAAGPGAGPLLPSRPDLSALFDDIGESVRKASVRGTFDARAVRGLAGNSPEERTAKAAERIREEVSRIGWRLAGFGVFVQP